MRRSLVLLLPLLAALVPATPAGACSCAGEAPRARLSQAGAAFVGTVTARSPAAGGGVVYALRVERAYKGSFAETVEVRSEDEGSTCSLSLQVGDRTGLLLSARRPPWRAGLCDRIAPRELERAARPYPRAPGSGVARLLATGPFHDAGLAALDGSGRLVGWAFGSEGDAVDACPGGRYAVQAGDGLSVIRMSDLRVVARRALPDDWTDSVRCLSRSGRDVAALTFAFGTGSDRRRLVRVLPGRVRDLGRRGVTAAVLARREAVLAVSRSGGLRLEAVDYERGLARGLAALGGSPGRLALAPDERHVAALLLGPGGERLLVASLEGTPPAARRVRAAGDPLWLSARRVGLPGAGGRATVFDAALRRTGTSPAWRSGVATVLSGRVWWLEPDGRLWRQGGDPRRVHRAPAPRLDGAGALAALRSGGRVRKAPGRRPGVSTAAVAAAQTCAAGRAAGGRD